jgi:Protein of unknown function (DUF2934)
MEEIMSNGRLFSEIADAPVSARGTSSAGPRAIRTRDQDVIRQWAARHHAEPATGQETASGRATIDVNDGGAGIRFNFPGAGRFRPISWDEWFQHFDRQQLTFVYEEDVTDRAYEIWQARGAAHGRDRDDWLQAEREMGGPADRPMGRYCFMKP